MGRMDQLSRTQEFKPEVSLFSASPNAYELLFSIWWGSRHNKSYTPKDLHQLLNPVSGVVVPHGDVNFLQMTDDILRAYPEYTLKECPSFITDLQSIFFNIVSTLFDSDLPPLEAVNFTFEIDSASVAFREQLVRDRRAGYWTQTSRTMDLQFMDVNMAHSIPLLGGDSAVDLYKSTVDVIRRAYRDLQKMGIPTEDIRLQPTAQVHRIYWMINLRNLMRVLHKRVDWIAQSSLWSPIISGVLHSLAKELDPALMNIIRDRVGAPKVTLSEDKTKVVSSLL